MTRAFLKTIEPGGQEFNEPQVQQIKISSQGLRGNDLRSFIKRAGHQFVDLLKKTEIKPGDIPVHLLAVGATEDYGCFAPGTPIAMADGSYLPIEDIAVGDFVLSADGKSRKVTWLFNKKVDESLCVEVGGLADILQCSLDHPFRIARREQFDSPAVFGNIATAWENASTLREGDYLVWTAPKGEPLWSMSAAEGYLIGNWLAAGKLKENASKRHTVDLQLSVHSDAVAFVEAAINTMEMDFEVISDTTTIDLLKVSSSGDPTRFALWQSTFGIRDFVIPPWVCCLPRAAKMSIIAGYIDGYTTNHPSDDPDSVTVSVPSRDFLLGFQRLCWSAGIPVQGVRDSKSNQLLFPRSSLADINYFSAIKHKLPVFDGWKPDAFPRCFCYDGRVYLPVKSFLISDAITVYNMEVDVDHTYSGPNVDSHNCNRNGDGFKRATCREFHDTFRKYAKFYRHHLNKDPLKSYGFVKASMFNESMKRIELLAMLNGTKEAADRNNGLLAEEEMAMLERGDDIPVSMSCKIAFDVCSGCGNRARNRDEYCTGTDEGGFCKDGGLKHRIGTFTGNDENPVLHADNPGPLFFDISRVIKPADRIAYSMGLLKASNSSIVTGSELAEFYGVVPPMELLATGELAHMYKIARRLSEIECELDENPASRYKLAFVKEVQPDIDWTSHGGRFGDVLQALSKQRISLPVDGFLQLVSQDRTKAAFATEATKAQLPGIYTRLLATRELDSLIQTNNFVPSTELAPLSVRRWSEKTAADFSLSRSFVEKRIVRGSVLHQSSVNTNPVYVKQAGSASEIAKHYAMYKLAFLKSIPEDSDFDLTLRLCVVQNYV